MKCFRCQGELASTERDHSLESCVFELQNRVISLAFKNQALRFQYMSVDGYVVEPLATGWFCRECKVFNGDAKEFLLTCRICGADRPKQG